MGNIFVIIFCCRHGRLVLFSGRGEEVKLAKNVTFVPVRGQAEKIDNPSGWCRFEVMKTFFPHGMVKSTILSISYCVVFSFANQGIDIF